MRVDLTTGAAVSEANIERAGVARTPTTPSDASRAAKANNSEFSESPSSAGKLAAAALSSPEVRAEKIQALQSQLQSGAYKVSPAQVAASIMNQMRVRDS